MARGANDSTATARPASLSKIIIVCEGKVTEPDYVNGLKIKCRLPNARVVVHKAQGDPKRVVDEAVRQKEICATENARLGINVKDLVWAIFDRDDHKMIPEAKQAARANGIEIAFTNPSFELFLLYHFQDLERPEHRTVVRQLLKRHIPNYGKSVNYEGLGLHEAYPAAKRRCIAVNVRSQLVRSVESPPYCGAYKLIDALRKLKV